MYVKEPGGEKFKGSILAATPEMLDPNFKQTLIFIADHDREGSLGLVLNRPLEKKLGSFLNDPTLDDKLSEVVIHYGGPVRPDSLLVALFHMDFSTGTVRCMLNAPLEHAAAHLKEGTGWVRAFAGYSGWGEGQLAEEVEHHAWTLCQPDPTLFEPRFVGGLWAAYIGGDQRWRKLMPYLPEDPEKN